MTETTTEKSQVGARCVACKHRLEIPDGAMTPGACPECGSNNVSRTSTANATNGTDVTSQYLQLLVVGLAVLVAGAGVAYALPSSAGVGRVPAGSFAAGAFALAVLLALVESVSKVVAGMFALLGAGALAGLVVVGSVENSRKVDERTRAAEAAEQQRNTEIASIPSRVEKVDALVTAGEWKRASQELVAIREIDPNTERLEDLTKAVEEGRRKRDIAQALEQARAVVGDRTRCREVKEVSDTWALLRQFRPQDSGFSKAARLTARLERCRKRAVRSLEKHVTKAQTKLRSRLAETMESGYIDGGISAKVRAYGSHKTSLKLTWIGISEAEVDQFEADRAVFKSLEDAGFKKFVMSDGFSTKWTFKLSPSDITNDWKRELANVGLDQPLSIERGDGTSAERAPTPKEHPSKELPQCTRGAKRLIAKGTQCGVNMRKYNATKICEYYRDTEGFGDNQAASRLDVFRTSGCDGIRAAVRGDRI